MGISSRTRIKDSCLAASIFFRGPRRKESFDPCGGLYHLHTYHTLLAKVPGINCLPQKINMRMENPLFEDVFPIEHGLVFRGVYDSDHFFWNKKRNNIDLMTKVQGG